MHYTFCPDCGQLLTNRTLGDDGLIPWCEGCKRPWFDTFSTCIIAAVMNPDGQVLLHRETRRPDREVLVAGYIKPGETAEAAACREIAEETGLTVTALRYVASWPHMDGNMLMLGYCAQAEGTLRSSSSEVVSSRWCTMDDAVASLREGSIAQQVVMAIRDSK
jgi:NAD+ diphosphatase